MRRLLLLAALLIAASAAAQDYNQPVLLSNGPPTGACAARKLDIDLTNSNLYFCVNGAWTLATSGGTPGTVTSIATTTPITGGPITSTGTIACPTCAATSPQYLVYLSNVSTCATILTGGAGTYTCARNNTTGAVDYSGTDAAVVINNALGAMTSTGGTIQFKNGIYSLNSTTQETAGACTAYYYAIGIPTSNSITSQVQFHFEGESRPIWPNENPNATSVLTNGVILNVTAAGVTSAGGGTPFIAAVWQRPSSAVTSCLSTYLTASNDLYFHNIGVRFPTNQRGNEGGFVVWNANSVSYDSVVADFALAYTAIESGSAPVVGSVGSFGISSTQSSSNNLQMFRDTYATGWDTCFDWLSEHVVLDTGASIYCNYAAQLGRTGGGLIYHPTELRHFTDQENPNGILLGPNMQAGSKVDMLGLDIETSATGWYARSAPGYVESTPGNSSGLITYEVVKANVGLQSNTLLFASEHGGQGFAYPSISSASDTFTRANANLAAPWVNLAGPDYTTLAVSSNVLTCTSHTCQSHYDTDFGNNQVSAVVLATVPTGTDQASVWTRVVGTNETTDKVSGYFCQYVSGTGVTITKEANGSFTDLNTAVVTTPAAKDVLALESIGSVHTCYLAGKPIIVVVDTAVTGGHPGVELSGTSGRLGAWTGRSLQ